MGDKCQECKCLEYHHVDGTEDTVVAVVGQQDEPTDDKLREQYEQPCHNHAHNAANILK